MEQNIKPILKWAGGKTQLLPQIIENLPKDLDKYTRYVEPFVGAGAVFYHFISNNQFEEYIINDINEKLINLYIVIQNNADELIISLENLKSEYFALNSIEEKEKYYYTIREKFNLDNSNIVNTSARLIFLNKTCFNGLYRENSKGLFNVPFGKHEQPSIYDETNIRELAKVFNVKNSKGERIVKISNTSFEGLYDIIDKNTFVYLDPPYRPVTKGGFTAYNKSNFNDDKQVALNKFFRRINNKGTKLMLSNSDPKVLDENDNFFDELYCDYKIRRVSARRMVNSNGKGRGAITELLITNYQSK